MNGTLKVELVYRPAYPTREKAREDIARWIELRYNRTQQEVLVEYPNRQEA